MEAAPQIKNKTIHPPGLVSRVKALCIDYLFMLILFALISVIINEIGEVATELRVGIYVCLILLYEPLFLNTFGGTLGVH